jgi:TolB protein
MRWFRESVFRESVAAVVAVLLVSMVPATSAHAASPQPGGRILYLEFNGSTGEVPGNLKSVQPNGLGGQDFGRQLWWASYPDYSPDGTRIAYVDGWSFRNMAADGTDDRWLVDGGSAPAFPRWSPDGQWIVGESGGDIWAVNKDGYAAGWTNLTGAHDSNDLIATWAPDGRRFATATYNDVRIYSADGARTRKIIPLPSAYRLDWRPTSDGQLAVEALGDLWLVDISSGEVRRLTNTPDIQETSPVWSPDGRWLAYGSGPGVHDPELPGFTTDPTIWLMDSKGGNRHSTGVQGVPTSWRAAA